MHCVLYRTFNTISATTDTQFENHGIDDTVSRQLRREYSIGFNSSCRKKDSCLVTDINGVYAQINMFYIT